MLRITIPPTESWDEEAGCFLITKEYNLQLEHSLVSLSKWESKWKKPFYSREDKTYEETIDYIRCMTITQNVPQEAYNAVSNDIINQVSAYIEDTMTATTFTEKRQATGNNGEMITSELIYYWMIALQIPMECQKWHLNRLLTLVRVCNIKNAPPKKMGRKETMNRNRSLNAARRARLNSKG